LRDAWRRRPFLDCGCSDQCRCDHKQNPSPKRIDAYRQAVEHLAAHKLGAAALTAECRGLWRRGGSDRRVAETIVRRWSA